MTPTHRNFGPASYIPRVSLDEYSYTLPPDRIAEHPLPERDRSRLLVCSVAEGRIEHHIFRDLPALISSDAMMVLNETRVVRARIVMQRPTGGRVELFLLEPVEPSPDPALALAAAGDAVWICMVGGARKFAREGELHGRFVHDGVELALRASLLGRQGEGFLVRFQWEPAGLGMGDVLEIVGRIPLPPYIKREATDDDARTYQTVYARREGAVAAPTAGLHFTPELIGELRAKGVRMERVALHVGAGTFKQVKGDVTEHEMHQERIAVSGNTLAALREHAHLRENSGGHPFVVVGTTSIRTLESLYWFGARLLLGDCSPDSDELLVEQWDPYRLASQHERLPSLPESLDAVERWRTGRSPGTVTGRTGIIIVPGYRFRCCDALITNFHQPGSTLILLVGALLGHDLWHRVYEEALATGYRFLSYGDSSLLALNGRIFD